MLRQWMRILFHYTCVILAILVVVTWVRSYWYSDTVSLEGPHPGTGLGFSFMQGEVSLEMTTSSDPGEIPWWRFRHDVMLTPSFDARLAASDDINGIHAWGGFGIRKNEAGAYSTFGIIMPHWFPFLIVTAPLTLAIWNGWRKKGGKKPSTFPVETP